MAEVTCRTVKRHYYKGKGYASAYQAYRHVAKEELKDLVLGPLVELKRHWTSPEAAEWENADQERWFGREKLGWLYGDEADQKVKDLYTEMFWRKEWVSGVGYFDKTFDHQGRRDWLDERARELMKEDGL